MSITPLEISNIMKRESPVFIVGAARSGTSILYRTIQRHSSFIPHKCQSASGVSLIESHVFKYTYSTYKQSDAWDYMLKDEEYYSQFLAAIQSIRKYQRLLVDHFLIQIIGKKIYPFKKLLFDVTKNDMLLHIFYYYAQQARGVKRIIDKPNNILLIREIKATFPNSKLLFIYRHPVDVFSSYRRRLRVSLQEGMTDSEVSWLKISPQQFCRDYIRYMEIALREEVANSEQFMTIRYEDFTSNPQAILPNICNFLGEPYQEACIPENQKKSSEWQIDPNLFGGIKKTTKTWMDFMSEDEARFIEEGVSKIMYQVGYPRYT